MNYEKRMLIQQMVHDDIMPLIESVIVKRLSLYLEEAERILKKRGNPPSENIKPSADGK